MGISYKHPNVVSLLGFCDEGDERILVYEHASNLSLQDYLGRVDKTYDFTWTRRLHMCLEIARGLNHLQTNMDHQKWIIHGVIKSANIFLYRNIKAKIAYMEFPKLRLANQGKEYYRDSKYANKTKLKRDIYSFGVVLFEIFCGRVAYDPIYLKENDKGLVPIARQCFHDGTIRKIMDPNLKEDSGEQNFTSDRGPNKDSLDTFLNVAYQCLAEADKRPTIKSVIKELERALNFHVSYI
ncbi:putative protein kinase RLK-Pelle-WAK family [Helianthus debilis subsp. tardiflorus]